MGNPPVNRTGTMGARTPSAMSRNAELIFITGEEQLKERVPSTWTTTDRAPDAISVANSPMILGRDARSERSKKVITRGSSTPGYWKFNAIIKNVSKTLCKLMMK